MYTNCNYQVNSIDKGLTIIQLTFNFLYPNFIVTKAYIPLLHLVIIYVCVSVLELSFSDRLYFKLSELCIYLTELTKKVMSKSSYILCRLLFADLRNQKSSFKDHPYSQCSSLEIHWSLLYFSLVVVKMGIKYSRMDQIKFLEKAFKKFKSLYCLP